MLLNRRDFMVKGPDVHLSRVCRCHEQEGMSGPIPCKADTPRERIPVTDSV